MSEDPIAQRFKNVPTTIATLESIKLDDANPNVMSPEKFAALRAHIATYGIINPVLVNTDGVVVDGAHRVLAARELGIAEIPVKVVDVTEVERRILRQTLNKTRGEHDADKDAAEFKFLIEHDGMDELARLLGEDKNDLLALIPRNFVGDADDFDPDAAVGAVGDTYVRRGDLYTLGDHVVMCGDATSREDVTTLMGATRADMVFTDPPYGVKYAPNKLHKEMQGMTSANTIKNDDLSVQDMYALWRGAFENACWACKDCCTYYVTSPQGSEMMMMMMMALRDSGWNVRHMLVWVKTNFVFSRLDYQYRHEPILYGWKTEGTHEFHGPNNEQSVWEIAKPSKNGLHPTMKPVALVARALTNSTAHGAVVVDLFGGSGSTLIACEQSGRRCFVMELDPKYVQVTIQRWESFTGRKAAKVGGGQ